MKRNRISTAPTAELEARLEKLDNGYESEEFEGEVYRITNQLDARIFAASDDERIREGTGNNHGAR